MTAASIRVILQKRHPRNGLDRRQGTSHPTHGQTTFWRKTQTRILVQYNVKVQSCLWQKSKKMGAEEARRGNSKIKQVAIKHVITLQSTRACLDPFLRPGITSIFSALARWSIDRFVSLKSHLHDMQQLPRHLTSRLRQPRLDLWDRAGIKSNQLRSLTFTVKNKSCFLSRSELQKRPILNACMISISLKGPLDLRIYAQTFWCLTSCLARIELELSTYKNKTRCMCHR